MAKIMIDNKEYELEPIKGECKPWGGPCGGDITAYYYKCPLCGDGMYIHVDEDTPGDRDHYSYLKCDNCDPEQLVYTSRDTSSSWDLRTTTLEERKRTRKIREEWNF